MLLKKLRPVWRGLLGVTLALSASGSVREFPAGHLNPAPDAKETRGLVIAVRPAGFVPPEIDLTDGRYVLIVQNQCGIRDLTFRLDREAGERLHEVHTTQARWKAAFDLHPGTYVLSVVDHPNWQCLIRVTSK